ncbi:hypothetical protein SAMN05421693_11835 [Ectothiorhodospira magna]|uniref:Uncharacterized protein n=1 Tax=Ectothiorhodospira magna TaxID=867345 RepID=A0A1H9DMT3_9GAMM|nr:hypothetical protein [Ectothiorhodospira magna]SEQ14729.1 hypothetical protein SAMN05421693_11835 [Ectothiorhodospira magna]
MWDGGWQQVQVTFAQQFDLDEGHALLEQLGNPLPEVNREVTGSSHLRPI